jgi:hypothetical protein
LRGFVPCGTISSLHEQTAVAFFLREESSRHSSARGLVRRRREGREHILSLNPEPLAELAAWIENKRALWTARLDDLERELGAEDKPKRSRS